MCNCACLRVCVWLALVYVCTVCAHSHVCVHVSNTRKYQLEPKWWVDIIERTGKQKERSYLTSSASSRYSLYIFYFWYFFFSLFLFDFLFLHNIFLLYSPSLWFSPSTFLLCSHALERKEELVNLGQGNQRDKRKLKGSNLRQYMLHAPSLCWIYLHYMYVFRCMSSEMCSCCLWRPSSPSVFNMHAANLAHW